MSHAKPPHARLGHRAKPRTVPIPTPVPAPPMPRKRGGWLASTRRRYAAWFESGRASLLDAAGLAALESLIRLVDEAERCGSPSQRLKLLKEVRLAEASLLRGVATPDPPPPTPDSRRVRVQAERQEHRRRRSEELAADGLSPDDAARRELAALES